MDEQVKLSLELPVQAAAAAASSGSAWACGAGSGRSGGEKAGSDGQCVGRGCGVQAASQEAGCGPGGGNGAGSEAQLLQRQAAVCVVTEPLLLHLLVPLQPRPRLMQ